MNPLVRKTIELRRMIDLSDGLDAVDGCDEKLDGCSGTDPIQRATRVAVRNLVLFFGFQGIDECALESLTTVVSIKLQSMARQLAILERRKADRQPQAYSSPILHLLSLHGVRSYSSLGDYYERHVRATYESVRARAAAHHSLSNKVGLCGERRKEVRGTVQAPVKRKEADNQDEEKLQQMGAEGGAIGDPSKSGETDGKVAKKKRRAARRL
ncbi:hypothetical protein PFISCL1PPCAC_489 [Pristionchus fissidentatus]|uniref:Uncharacterized protein n=1 Tax=Pristionchus fissidentatus TaxID=1538716 RepID=A0AAV5USH5_9BILA|nr:hypothetical protein PFISCL1PPCAC_489 [Pristionchus fissidentatus]